jgi:hypothetical protein
MNDKERPLIDYTNKDYASLRESLLKIAQEKLPVWTDHSANDLGVVLVELFAYMGDILLYYQDRIANESYLATAQERRSVINLLRLIGCEMRPAVSASAGLSLYFATAGSGTVTIPRRAEFQARINGNMVKFQYLGPPLTIDLDQTPAMKTFQEKLYKLYETLPVVQVDGFAPAEILGSSDGSPNQRYRLALASLIADTLEVTVDEGGGPKAWTAKPSLLDSKAVDEHYLVQRDDQDQAWIIFGDGKYGRIPPLGRNNIIATYCSGGGIKGNVPPNSITKIITPINHLQKVNNTLPATGGAEREPTADAAQRGPHLFRSMGRAVTARDYEFQAKEFGVGKARARAPGWNYIELFVAPVGGGQPTDTLKEDLRAYFEAKRIMTSILHICDPVYVPVFIQGKLFIEPYYPTEQVKQNVKDAILSMLAFDNVEFEDVLYLSKVYEKVEAIEGVAGIYIGHFSITPDPADNLPPPLLRFGWNEIPISGYSGGIDLVEVHGGRHAP